MNILDRARQIKDGAETIAEWIGAGGHVVSQEDAQARADVCLTCALNQKGTLISNAVAVVIKKHLKVKNKLGLTVKGAKRLKTCTACSCVLNLLIWCPQRRIQPFLTDEELQKYPSFCWKLKEP